MTLLDREHNEGNIFDELEALALRVAALEAMQLSNWRGLSSVNFTTTTLPNDGDYGYQTTDDEVQINVGGTIRAISTAAP